MSESLTRLIGPIPTSYTSAVGDGFFAHPGGPAPRWGGYAPVSVEVPLSWLSIEIQALVTQPSPNGNTEGCSLRGMVYQAHTTDTLLILAEDGWYVAAPARPCWRAVTIAVEALKDGAKMPGGLLPEEATEAVRTHREGGAAHRMHLFWKTPEPTTEPVNGDDEIE